MFQIAAKLALVGTAALAFVAFAANAQAVPLSPVHHHVETAKTPVQSIAFKKSYYGGRHSGGFHRKGFHGKRFHSKGFHGKRFRSKGFHSKRFRVKKGFHGHRFHGRGFHGRKFHGRGFKKY